MKKYLVFGISSQMGGVESFLMNYVSKMKDEENIFEFVIFDCVPDFLENSKLSKCKMHIVPKRTKNPILYYRKLQRILLNGKYDVIWYNVCTLSDITLLKIAKEQRVQCRIVHSHNGANMGGRIIGLLHKKNKNIIERYATDFFACSNLAAEFMFPSDVVSGSSVRIIKNAIDTEKYKFNKCIRERIRDLLGVGSELLIGHVGRFHFQKNHKFILKIFTEVLKKEKNAKLLLIGNGELKEQFCKQAEEKKIIHNIIMLENRSDVNELLQAMDVFLFPSLFEGLPISLIEAQTADLPCVISDTISHEVCITKKNRVLSLSESPEVWAQNVIESGSDKRRIDQTELLKDQGYDIQENAIRLKNHIYKILEMGE